MKRPNKFSLFNLLFSFLIISALVLLQQNFYGRNNIREDKFILADRLTESQTMNVP